MSYKIIFLAETDVKPAGENLQVFVSDGTSGGTVELPTPGTPGGIIALSPGLSVFSDSFASILTPNTLWATDGTVAGTHQILSSRLGYDIALGYFVTFGNKALIQAGPIEGLFVTDGTASGTFQLSLPAPPAPGVFLVNPGFAALGNDALFSATGSDLNQDLWITDGTNAGTHVIYAPATPATQAGGAQLYSDLTTVGSVVFFVAKDANKHPQLWVTDGTTSGTHQISVASAGALGLGPSALTPFNGKLLFEGNATTALGALWISDGTSAGTTVLTPSTITVNGRPVQVRVDAGGQGSIAIAGTKAYFVANSILWVTDGTPAGTSEITATAGVIQLVSGGSATPQYAPLGTSLLFQGVNSLNKAGLWITDGTNVGTHEIMPANAYFFGVDPTDMIESGNEVFFRGRDASGFYGLWVTDGTATGTSELSTAAFAAAGPNPIDLVAAAPPVANGAVVLGTLSINQQLELIYIAYFNRSADGGGSTFWSGQNGAAQSGGQTAAVALTNIANSFAPQAETVAIYSFLAPLVTGASINLNTPTAQADLTAFIGSVYQNLFNRAADPSGQTYWVGQITAGAVGLGAAALAIANGATGADATEVLNKITVALDFTTRTSAAGLGTAAPLPTSFVTAARGVLSGVDGTSLNDASVTAGESATTSYIVNPASSQSVVLGMNTETATPITISASNSVVDPGVGNYTIQFVAGTAADTLVLHATSLDQVSGFDPSTDVLDLRSLLSEANIDLNGDIATLSRYVTVVDQGVDALMRFDPIGQAAGGTIADLAALAGNVTNLETLITQGAIRVA